MTRMISWNVNGLRACMTKGFMEFFDKISADIFCVQETKLQGEQISLELDGYLQYWNYADKKGYSGTAIFTRLKPLAVTYGIGMEEHDSEGRVITLEFEDYYFINVYAPNAKRELERLEYRMKWEDDFRCYLADLDRKKPVVFCGDLNVAHKEIDLKNPSSNKNSAGFTPEERGKLSELLAAGFIDSFRYLYPDRKDVYTWWSYMFKAREKNAGWRIDYFCVSERISSRIAEAEIFPDIMGSDHCPVGLTIT